MKYFGINMELMLRNIRMLQTTKGLEHLATIMAYGGSMDIFSDDDEREHIRLALEYMALKYHGINPNYIMFGVEQL